MKIRALSALVYLMGGLISLTLAVAFASWIVRPSSAQEQETMAQSEVPLPPPAEEVPAPGAAPATAVPSAAPAATVPTADAVVPPPPTSTLPPPQPNAAGQVPPPTAGSQPLNLPARDFLEPYIFDAREGRRNPFRPLSLSNDDEVANVGPTTPLELYEVDEFKLLAIMWDVKNPRALLMDPNKEIHVVNKDDRIGRKKGYIATIREGEVVVVETGEFNGEAIYSTRIMQLQK